MNDNDMPKLDKLNLSGEPEEPQFGKLVDDNALSLDQNVQAEAPMNKHDDKYDAYSPADDNVPTERYSGLASLVNKDKGIVSDHTNDYDATTHIIEPVSDDSATTVMPPVDYTIEPLEDERHIDPAEYDELVEKNKALQKELEETTEDRDIFAENFQEQKDNKSQIALWRTLCAIFAIVAILCASWGVWENSRVGKADGQNTLTSREVESKQNQIDNLNGQLAQLQKEKDQSNAQVKDLEKQKKDLESSNKGAVAAKDKQIGDLQNSVNSANSAKDNAQSQANAAKKQVEDQRKTNQQLQDRISSLESELSQSNAVSNNNSNSNSAPQNQSNTGGNSNQQQQAPAPQVN